MLEKNARFILIFLLAIANSCASVKDYYNINAIKSAAKSYVKSRLFDHLELASFWSWYAYSSANEWKRFFKGTVFNNQEKQLLKEYYCSEEPQSAYFTAFHHHVLAEAGVKNVQKFMIMPQSRPADMLDTAISDGILWTSLDVDDALLILQNYLETSNQKPTEIILSTTNLINLYNRSTDLPIEVQQALIMLLLSRGIIFHEAGHCLHQDTTQLGIAKKLLIKTTSCVAASTFFYCAQKLYGWQGLLNRLEKNKDSRERSSKDISDFINIHIGALITTLYTQIIIEKKFLDILSRRNEKNADMYAFENVSQEELLLLIRLWEAMDEDFTHNLIRAIGFVEQFNYDELDFFEYCCLELEDNPFLVMAKSLARHYVRKNNAGKWLIQLPESLSASDASVRSIFFNTHPDHRDRALHAKEVYHRRFGNAGQLSELSSVASAA